MKGKIAAAPEIKKVPFGKGNAHFCAVRIGENDVRRAQFMPGAGVDAAPCEGDAVTCEYIGSQLFITGVQSREPQAKGGEHHRYIRNEKGETLTELHFDGDGNIAVKNGENYEINIKADKTGIVKIGNNTLEFTNGGITLNGNLEVLQ